MRARHASYRGSKGAVPHAHDSGWTVIGVVVALAVAIAVAAFCWFID